MFSLTNNLSKLQKSVEIEIETGFQVLGFRIRLGHTGSSQNPEIDQSQFEKSLTV